MSQTQADTTQGQGQAQAAETQRVESQNVTDQAAVTPKRAGRNRKSASAFKTISEVATALDVQQHVLRFWETKFSQIRPLKRGGGRRYYRPEDLALLQKIHYLLYTEGYTIKGVQKLLREKGKAAFLESAPEATNNNEGQTPANTPASTDALRVSAAGHGKLESVVSELKALREKIRGA